MSAWPEAVWLKNEINKALGMDKKIEELSQRLSLVEHRYLFLSASQPSESSISAGSLWAKIEQD